MAQAQTWTVAGASCQALLPAGTAGSLANATDGSDTFTLGPSGNLTFMPTYHVADGAAAGIYSAQCMLINQGSNSNARSSGNFYLDFSVPTTPVPEPGTWVLFGAGLLGLVWLGRRRSAPQR